MIILFETLILIRIFKLIIKWYHKTMKKNENQKKLLVKSYENSFIKLLKNRKLMED